MNVKFRKDIYYTLLLTVILVLTWAVFLEDERIAKIFWLGFVMLIAPFVTIIRGWNGIKVSRILPKKRIYAGNYLEVKLEASNSFIIPLLWMNIIERYPLRYISKQKVGGELSAPIHFLGRSKKHFSYLLEDVPRGRIKWDRVSILRNDIMGFVTISKEQELQQDMLVYPKHVDMDIDRLLNKDENHGASRVIRGNDYSQISGVRDYERGDKLSLVHWKVSARKNSLMSKEFFPLLNQEAHIILDCDRNNYPGYYNEDFELAVSVAASIANSLAKYEKGLLLKFNNKQREVINYKSSQYFVSKVMDSLATVEANGVQPLERMLNYSYLNFHDNRGITLFIITNRIDENLLQRLSLGSSKLRAKVYLVGESVDGLKLSKYSFVNHVKSLNQLKTTNTKVRRISNG